VSRFRSLPQLDGGEHRADEGAGLLRRRVARDAHVDHVAPPRLAPRLGVARELSARQVVSVEEQECGMAALAVSMAEAWGNHSGAGSNAPAGTVLDV
jgi:hypothetical protein